VSTPLELRAHPILTFLTFSFFFRPSASPDLHLSLCLSTTDVKVTCLLRLNWSSAAEALALPLSAGFRVGSSSDRMKTVLSRSVSPESPRSAAKPTYISDGHLVASFSS